MSKSVMLRTSNEDIKLNIDNYPTVNANHSLTNLPEGWSYVISSKATELNEKFKTGCGVCFTNTRGTAFQIYICDDRNETYVRRCISSYTDLTNATWSLMT